MKQVNTDNFGFVVLCPERNVGGLRLTIRSAQAFFPDKPCVCIVGDNASRKEIEEFGTLCRTVRAGSTYSSLINTGVSENRADWSLFFMAGHPVRPGVMTRYEHFCKSPKHVLFPVIDRKWLFHESSIHCLFLHKNALTEVGTFTDQEEDFEKVKLLWAGEALSKGYEFRAVVSVPR